MPRKDQSQSHRSKKKDSKLNNGSKSIYSSKHNRLFENRGAGKNNKIKNKQVVS